MASSEVSTDYQAILADDKGNPVFVDYAKTLRQAGDRLNALQVLLAGLSVNPALVKGKLLLAQLFVEIGCTPFAVRELEELHRELPQNGYIKKLIEALAPGRLAALAATKVVAAGEEKRDGSDALKEEDKKATSGSLEANSDKTIAEAEFSFDDLDLVEDDPKKH